MQLVQSAICTGLEEIIRKKTKTETRNQKHHLLQGTAIPAGPCNLQHTHVCLLPITTREYISLSVHIWLHSSVVRTSVSDRRTFPGLRSICSGCVTTYVGITSAIGQPTRPNQPFIFPGSINE